MLTQGVENSFMHLLNTVSPVNNEKYIALLSDLIKGYENRFQDC